MWHYSLQEPSQRLLAGVLPRSAEHSGLFLAAVSPESPWKIVVGPAAELLQQTEHAEESSGGPAAGEPQGGSPVRWGPAAGAPRDQTLKKDCKYLLNHFVSAASKCSHCGSNKLFVFVRNKMFDFVANISVSSTVGGNFVSPFGFSWK